MKGIKFFLEYPNAKEKRKATRDNLGNHTGNVIATLEGTQMVGRSGAQIDALAGVFFTENSPVATSAVSYEYLGERCKRISEATAREIHPELFKRLDYEA